MEAYLGPHHLCSLLATPRWKAQPSAADDLPQTSMRGEDPLHGLLGTTHDHHELALELGAGQSSHQR
eukprot:197068-Rhodomonas_salina.1